jgi:hypothetical protein
MFDGDWQQKKYDEVFELVLQQVRFQMQSDPDFSMDYIRARLEDAYVLEGHGWEGKGIILEISEAATIAAYEYILAEWDE